MIYLISALLLLPVLFFLNKRYIKNITNKTNYISVVSIYTLSSILTFYSNYIDVFQNISVFVLYMLMFLLTFIDLKKMEIPDELNIILFFYASIYILSYYEIEVFLFGMQLLGIFTALWFISEALFKKEMFGLGDLLYISILAYLTNDTLSIVYMFLISSLIAIPISFVSIKLFKKNEIPYLPFLTIAFVIETLFGISKI